MPFTDYIPDAVGYALGNDLAGVVSGRIPSYLFQGSAESTPEDYGGGAYTRRSALATCRFRSSASSVTVRAIRHGLGTASWRNLGVYVDGAWHTSLAITSDDTIMSLPLSLPGYDCLVEIVDCLQSKPTGNPVQGGYVIGIDGPAMMLPPKAATRKLAVYGDSIAVGDGSTIPTRDCVWQKSRGWYPGIVGLEAWGFRGVCNEASIDDLAARLVELVAGVPTREIWLAIGTNDYGLNLGSAATYQTALGNLCDAINALDSGATVYLQSPLNRTTETANSFGNTLGDYRTAAATVAAARSGFVTYVDGDGLLNPATDLADGIHPTTAGHAKYAGKVFRQFGFTVPVTTGLVMRHDASVGLTLVTGDASDWVDQVGSHDMAQATAANRPTYGAAIANGFPGLQFNASDFMTAPDDAELDVGTGSYLWVAAISKPHSANFTCVYSKSSNADAANIRVIILNSELVVAYWGADAGGNYTVSTLAIPNATMFALAVGVDSANNQVVYAINGTIERFSITPSGAGSNSLPVRIHGDNSGGFATDPVIYGEHMFFNLGASVAISDADIAALCEGYLAPKFGII